MQPDPNIATRCDFITQFECWDKPIIGYAWMNVLPLKQLRFELGLAVTCIAELASTHFDEHEQKPKLLVRPSL